MSNDEHDPEFEIDLDSEDCDGCLMVALMLILIGVIIGWTAGYVMWG